MHHDRVVLGMGQLFGVQTVEVVIFALRRDEPAIHAFLLKPQHHHDVHVLQPLGHVLVDLAAKLSDARGHQGRRADQADPVFHLAQQDQVGPRHPRMRDVPADRDGQPVQPALLAADRQRVQQGLGGMFVAPVTGIQHGAVHLLRQQVDRAGMRVPHDQQIGMHRVQRHRRVDQRLALLYRRRLEPHVHHVRAQPLARQFETGLGAGGVLEEHVDLGQTLQRLGMLVVGSRQGDVIVGKIEDGRDFIRGEGFDPQQMVLAKAHLCLPWLRRRL